MLMTRGVSTKLLAALPDKYSSDWQTRLGQAHACCARGVGPHWSA
jgi:hypothetical protein